MRKLAAYRFSIRTRLVLAVLLLCISAIGVMALVTRAALLRQVNDFSTRLTQAADALRADAAGRSLANAAADAAVDIDTFVLERLLDLRRISEAQAVVRLARLGTQAAQERGLSGRTQADEDISAALEGGLLLPTRPTTFAEALSYAFKQTELPETPFVEILVTEASGINLVLTRPATQVSHAREGWWQAAANPGLGGVGIIPPFIDEASGLPCIGIALPVVDDQTRQVTGVVRGVINLKSLQQRLSEKAVRLEADIQVFTREGLLVADTQSNHSLERLLNQDANILEGGFEPAALALAVPQGSSGADLTPGEGSGPDGNLIAGYARTSGSDFYDAPAQLAAFGGVDWGVTVVQPEEQFLQSIRSLEEASQAFTRLPDQLNQAALLLALLFSAAGVLGAVLLAETIIQPLGQLRQASQRVQAGDLETRVVVTGRDEPGELEKAFNGMVAGLRQREQERDIFGSEAPPAVREKLLSGELRLDGERRRVTVLYADIHAFPSLTDQMPAREVVALLNEYLAEMTEVIRFHDGYISSFAGDAIVAIFGAPLAHAEKEWQAVAAALEMHSRLAHLNERRAERGEARIVSGMGICSGEATAGRIGTLDRQRYTFVGGAVNTAARLAALTRDFPEHAILVDQQTADAVQSRTDVQLTPLGPVQARADSELPPIFGAAPRPQA